MEALGNIALKLREEDDDNSPFGFNKLKSTADY